MPNGAICCTAALSTFLLISDVTFVSPRDSELKNLLIGAWVPDRNRPANEVEREAIKYHIFGVTHLEPNGTGFTNIYVGKLCGRLVRHHTFRWNVEDGILVTFDRVITSRDRILSASSKRAALAPATGPSDAREYRLKIRKMKC